MNGFSILMFIFASLVLLVGLFMYTGHKLDILTGRAAFNNLSRDEWVNIGKYTCIVSIFIYLLGIIGIIFNFN